MFFIFLNMLLMCLEHYGQSKTFDLVLTYLNYVFLGIFTIEFIMKFTALKFSYFKSKMNLFDFLILLLSIFGLIIEVFFKSISSNSISFTVFRVIRLARFGRILRLFKAAKEIRSIIFALTKSFSALFNIGLLLFLVIFIYAIFGMNFFMNVSYSDDILTGEFNFENIYRSVLTLFPLSTSGGSNELLNVLSYPLCNTSITTNNFSNDTFFELNTEINTTNSSQFTEGDCGNPYFAIPFYISFIIITNFVILNMYTAIILDSYEEANTDVQEGLTDDDFDLYYQVWQQYDPDLTYYINYYDLSDFVDSLYEKKTLNLCKSNKENNILYESKLRIAKPNQIKLNLMNINICSNRRIFCDDILEALIKNFIKNHRVTSDSLFGEKIFSKHTKKKPDDYIVIGSTLQNESSEEMQK
jgi:hypothetical protein